MAAVPSSCGVLPPSCSEQMHHTCFLEGKALPLSSLRMLRSAASRLPLKGVNSLAASQQQCTKDSRTAFSLTNTSNSRGPYPPQAAKGFGGQKTKQSLKKPSPSDLSEVEPAAATPLQGKPLASDEDIDDAVPEVVTNRMLVRIVVTVGSPLAVGLLFFPLFYWLKVVQKVDLPEWVPLIVSSAFFGAAGLGISYGVLSASWDPNKEGSFWGWREAQANWPVLWATLRGKDK